MNARGVRLKYSAHSRKRSDAHDTHTAALASRPTFILVRPLIPVWDAAVPVDHEGSFGHHGQEKNALKPAQAITHTAIQVGAVHEVPDDGRDVGKTRASSDPSPNRARACREFSMTIAMDTSTRLWLVRGSGEWVQGYDPPGRGFRFFIGAALVALAVHSTIDTW